eukprot:jgi/Botrbrau1/17237/Bobra.0865s0004.1
MDILGLNRLDQNSCLHRKRDRGRGRGSSRGYLRDRESICGYLRDNGAPPKLVHALLCGQCSILSGINGYSHLPSDRGLTTKRRSEEEIMNLR